MGCGTWPCGMVHKLVFLFTLGQSTRQGSPVIWSTLCELPAHHLPHPYLRWIFESKPKRVQVGPNSISGCCRLTGWVGPQQQPLETVIDTNITPSLPPIGRKMAPQELNLPFWARLSEPNWVIVVRRVDVYTLWTSWCLLLVAETWFKRGGDWGWW